MSVAEAVDKGYMVVFTRRGVYFYSPKDVMVRGEPILTGTRDVRTRLFYFNVDDVEPKVNQIDASSPNMDASSSLNVPLSPVPAKFSPLALIPAIGVQNSFSGLKWFELTRVLRVEEKHDYSMEPSPELADALSSIPLGEVTAKLTRTYHEFKSDFDLWHPRLAHINSKLARTALPDLKDYPKKCHCDNCTRGKFHKHSHSGKRPSQSELCWSPGEYLTCDLFGPLLRSRGNARYVSVFCDYKSRFVYVKCLKDKTGELRCYARSFSRSQGSQWSEAQILQV